LVDWKNYHFDWFMLYWNQFVEWFMVQPLFAQILVVAGIFAILSLTLVIVYYIIKGFVYLVYYILKGVYYLLRYIALGVYKLFKALYYAISGKKKPTNNHVQNSNVHQNFQQDYKPHPSKIIRIKEPDKVRYCSECGAEFTEKVSSLLISRGRVYCEHCGKKFYSNPLEVSS